MEAAREQLAQYSADKVRINAELSSLDSLIEQMSAQSDNSGKLLAESMQKIENAKKNIADSERQLGELAELIRSAEETLAQGQGDREKLRQKRAEISEKLSQLRIEEH